MKNIEIKARVSVDLSSFEKLVQTVSGKNRPDAVLAQDDTFFVCATGRLKLRTFVEKDGSRTRGELIAYMRPDQQGPKMCEYSRVSTDDPAALHHVLATSCGIVGRVQKRRLLYLVGATRIHIDNVEGLDFPCMELEVVVEDLLALESSSSSDSSAILDRAVAIANDLMSKLGIDESHLLHDAYIDMLIRSKSSEPRN
jgi:adenylate cyclase class IV